VEASSWVAVLAIAVTLLLASIGAGWTVFTRQNDQLRKRIEMLESDLKLSQATVTTQRETVSELKLQNAKLEMSAETQNRFFGELREWTRKPGTAGDST
jgi:hypothetical protein